MADTEKLVFMVLHGPNEPEHATIPFVMACAALASDVDVVVCGPCLKPRGITPDQLIDGA